MYPVSPPLSRIYKEQIGAVDSPSCPLQIALLSVEGRAGIEALAEALGQIQDVPIEWRN